MTTRVEAIDDRHVDIHVFHAPAQSYSRSVDPKAMRTARTAPEMARGRQWELFSVDYSIEPREVGETYDPVNDRSESVFHFRAA